ncbi:MAG: hypothetical protein WCJ41_07475 [Aestuariivirga sp.]|jgi:hypothetical protein|uniref:hypothetical protein n=1 Tax=Aestuariivirga sp. TaxID=2650926 RepID=UPI003016C0F0
MLGLFSRLRKPVERVHAISSRPLRILESRQSSLAPMQWQSHYCSTMVYFWVAVVTEEVCRSKYSEDEKHRVLQRVFARIVKEMRGVPAIAKKCVLPDGHPHRLKTLADLKRAVELRRNGADARLMIYADYREAVEGDGRPAVFGNHWGVRTEAAHEILLARYLASNLTAR